VESAAASKPTASFTADVINEFVDDWL